MDAKTRFYSKESHLIEELDHALPPGSIKVGMQLTLGDAGATYTVEDFHKIPDADAGHFIVRVEVRRD